MDLSNVQELLINFVPALTVLLGFLATGIGLLAKIKEVFKNSNIDTLKQNFTDNSENLSKRCDQLLSYCKQLAQENETLKGQMNELLGELKRIADYEYKE